MSTLVPYKFTFLDGSTIQFGVDFGQGESKTVLYTREKPMTEQETASGAQVPCISLLAAIDRVLAGVPTLEDGHTCDLRDVRRVLQDNSAAIPPLVFIPQDDAPTPAANAESEADLPDAIDKPSVDRLAAFSHVVDLSESINFKEENPRSYDTT